MPLVASIDYPSKRIFLGPDSVGITVDTMDIYREVREQRRTNPAHRLFRPLISAFGNQPAGPSNTPRYTVLAQDARIVPYGGVSHELTIGTSLVSLDEGLAGVPLFDRSSLAVQVDITYQPPQVEVIEIPVSGLTTDELQMIIDIWTRLDLNAMVPNTYDTDRNRIANALWTLQASETATQKTVQRQ